MSKHYYVIAKGNFEGQPWQPIAGPYHIKETAKKLARQESRHTGDLRDEVHTQIVTRTWLAKNGYPFSNHGREALILAIQYAEMERASRLGQNTL